jgi:hypothetical protein
VPGDGAIVRDGELTAEALANAIGAEQAQGRRPAVLAVGSQRLREAALRIVDGPDAFSCLRAGLPRVEVDDGATGLAEHEWELREA